MIRNHSQDIQMKYQHHQGKLQHTSIHKRQEQREATRIFFHPQACTQIKVLHATLLMKANQGVQIKHTPPLPQKGNAFDM